MAPNEEALMKSNAFRSAGAPRRSLLILAAAVACAAAGPLAAQDDLAFRRIWTSTDEGPGLDGSGLPIDGRYMPTIDWGTGDLVLFDLQRGSVEPVTDKGDWTESRDFAIGGGVLSPDRRWIAYPWAHFASAENQLRVIGRDGTGERVLASQPMQSWIEPRAWTPDGASIVVLLGRSPEHRDGLPPSELRLVSTDDGSARVLQSLDFGSIGNLFVSPDGAYAAYTLVAEDGDGDVYAIALDRGSPRALIEGNGDDRLMGWHPDGSAVFFYSDRELTRGIWKLPVSNGRATGEPELVRADVWDMQPLGFVGDRFYYGVVRASAQVRTVTLDSPGGEVVSGPTMIREPSEGWSRNPAWSSDGQYLAFVDYPAGNAVRLEVAEAMHKGATQYLAFPFRPFARPYWGSDRGTMLVVGRHGNEQGIHRLDLMSGEVTFLRESPEQSPQGSIALSPDGKTYYFHRDRREVWAGDVATGRETLLGSVDGVQRRIAVSPDGQTLIMRAGEFDGETRLYTMPASGGAASEIYRGPVLRNGSSWLEMTPDGRYVLAGSFATPPGVWRFPVDGGEPVKILEGEAPRGFRMSPDGRRLAYWEWPDPEGAQELWVIEGLTEAGGDR
jgi:Tol biopolymer transport system component